MGMATKVQVEIAAPAAEVFRWLAEPAKLLEWQGASGAMPADTSTLPWTRLRPGIRLKPNGEAFTPQTPSPALAPANG